MDNATTNFQLLSETDLFGPYILNIISVKFNLFFNASWNMSFHTTYAQTLPLLQATRITLTVNMI